MAKTGREGPPRAYARLTLLERKEIQEALERGKGCREIARGLGRSPSSISEEIASHRYVTRPRELRGEHAPGADELARACPRLGSFPRCCNGCRRRSGYGCSLRPQVRYDARLAQDEADRELRESRSGVDETEETTAAKLALIRDGLARGLSPAQVAASTPGLGLSASTVYRWVEAGYDGMTNMELRRKVGYRPRRHAAPGRTTRHSPSRSHDAFEALPGDVRANAWEMDTVEGSRSDSACLLTLLHRPSRFQLALPLPAQDCASVAAALGALAAVLGDEGLREAFPAVLTDNGSEFSDEGAVAAALGEREGETRLFYCDPRQSQQKGACEKNHVEIRKMLPKGRGLRFDLLGPADCALVMSHVNSQPRASLGWRTPAEALVFMLGDAGEAVMEAFGVERVPAGRLDLTYARVARDRERRGEPPLA